MTGEPFVTIDLDKHGNIVRVRQGRKNIEPERRTRAKKTEEDKDKERRHKSPITLQHPKVPKKGKRGGGSDPCCIVDSGTGELFCWC